MTGQEKRQTYKMQNILHTHTHKHFTPFQVIILGFAGVILFGTLLLMLPVSSQSGQPTSIIDALFTSTSAVCVTGLIVFDTATYWSVFGQAVIIILIQIGGMGVITVASSIAMLSGKKITLMQRSTIQEALAAPKVGGIVRLTGFIIKTTLITEIAGAVLMSPVFCKKFGILRGIWMSLFHSISAFCNAGFDLMGSNEKFSSLTFLAENPVINIVIMSLIIFGGIGFLTWDDIRTNKFHLKKYRMQSKIILCTTAMLLLIPALYFFFIEFRDEPISRRIWTSLFQVVTPRTAGFNTVPLNTISEAGLGILIILMLIGGAPGSTAGGMKITTIAVMFKNSISVFRKKEQAQFFGRSVSDDAVKSAATIFLLYTSMFISGGIVISIIEDMPLTVCLFETASAIGTVGLSLGVTPTLCTASKLILAALMYLGRVGGMTLVFAALSSKTKNISKYPQEKIIVG